MPEKEFLQMLEIGAMAYLAACVVDSSSDDDDDKVKRRRNTDGSCAKLPVALHEEGPELNRNAMLMSSEQFDYLLNLVKPHIEKADTRFRKSISAGTRLALTLRYLATGENFNSLRLIFGVAQPTISAIVPEVLDAIYKVLVDEFFKITFPKNEAEWEAVAKQFDDKWNFPHCIGAVDGKRVMMKGTDSIVLIGVADADYKLLYVDVGHYGRSPDAGLFSRCTFSQALDRKLLHLPTPRALPSRELPMPYVLVADDAFAMQPNVMKPYANKRLSQPQRVFNYRLSRARRIIENVFGIMSARFRVLRNPILLNADKAKRVVMACAVLHNFLMTKNKPKYAPASDFDLYDAEGNILRPADWRAEPPTASMHPLEPTGGPIDDAKKIQEEFMYYFTGEGELS